MMQLDYTYKIHSWASLNLDALQPGFKEQNNTLVISALGFSKKKKKKKKETSVLIDGKKNKIGTDWTSSKLL